MTQENLKIRTDLGGFDSCLTDSHLLGKTYIFFPLLERISHGDVICMNGINYSYLFPFNLFRSEILDYIPFAMLSCNEEPHIFKIE